ncbi:NirD/YgiW/YdeI family stress tolerance protein [Acinetobacter sp. 194]|uniref:NirD/YgiW/YdeI family stress tolerance protein n=1 Tax=Acinetobacter shaoyimingii TaxID=2715164 RepID=UPI00140A29E4|nr:NirD/YgiW/YdeI family stress tolerance protein [Acinetobacter shaoyimingii]NHB58315.1 NirD/YgiW/YdeI family stress tolerance protein [Acinetobacter shaoyimingii]
MNVFTKTVLAIGLAGATTLSMANAVNQNAIAPKTATVKQALTLKDDTKVQLKGFIVKSIGDEKYQFRDNTGTMTVDIDDELWNGKAISATTPVTILGEVDVDYKPTKRVEIDVDGVRF